MIALRVYVCGGQPSGWLTLRLGSDHSAHVTLHVDHTKWNLPLKGLLTTVTSLWMCHLCSSLDSASKSSEVAILCVVSGGFLGGTSCRLMSDTAYAWPWATCLELNSASWFMAASSNLGVCGGAILHIEASLHQHGSPNR